VAYIHGGRGYPAGILAAAYPSHIQLCRQLVGQRGCKTRVPEQQSVGQLMRPNTLRDGDGTLNVQHRQLEHPASQVSGPGQTDSYSITLARVVRDVALERDVEHGIAKSVYAHPQIRPHR
jgi:hypothetical protein